MVRLAFLGDVMLGRGVGRAISEKGPRYPWGDTLGELEKADLRMINLECVISDRGEPWTRTEKVFHFRADPNAIEVLKAADIDFVSLANNHTLDYNEDAMLDMIRRLDRAGIKHAGAGKDLAEASKPAFLEACGIKIAVISITDNVPEWEAKEGAPGVNFVPTWPTADNIPYGQSLRSAKALPVIGNLAGPILNELAIWPRMAACADGLAAKARGADLVVCSLHLGPNWPARPSGLFRRFAHRLADLGVGVYHGHSAHVFQGVEIYKNKPILYGTGDFIDDYAVDGYLRNDWSFIFMLDIDEVSKRTVGLELIPVVISGCQANLATEPVAGEICDRMIRQCRDLGTQARREGRGLIIDI
ncbi:MAG: CapA family protein [Candidatus Micrarchaeia archaeon]